MKRCPECAREIEESATVCEACAEWMAAHLPASADNPMQASAPEPSTRAESTTPTRGSGINRRELLLVMVVVIGAAVVTLAMLFVRGGPSANVSAATVATAPRQPAATAPESSASPVLHQWSTDNRAYWLGNQRHGAAFELQADNLVQTWFGPVRPTLVVRCTARTMQTFVYTGSPMKIEPHAEGKTVILSVDDEPVKTERWPDSDDHDALFAPDGAAFAHRLLGARSLRFGYSPHNANDVVARFHVSGLAELLDPVAKECGWTK